ncbi:ribonuclease HII [Hansschlegelia plantiphila]|uniref:Ribonuclease HII n=1 Tax=Hansschlegelia plantiphila TaxID=374655 RepID=A0A9W6J1X0_9HYPH|nr:ribonuclease HII [Hansschlegelia plantiphila]GLK67769.1 ribonuclease HII [Hansschlegelia plantiphila]
MVSKPVAPPKPVASFKRERDAMKAGARCVAGVDEAGRGPLAGPVVAAAVVLDPRHVPKGLADSKMLSAVRREELFIEIMATSAVAFTAASTDRIERINIRGATLWAMARAVASLGVRPDLVLVDGRDAPPGLACRAEPVIGGDALVQSIAAASIVAKVVRDRMMARLGECFPAYGFERHMGYGTPEHLAALAAVGPCSHHRRKFAPIAALLAA